MKARNSGSLRTVHGSGWIPRNTFAAISRFSLSTRLRTPAAKSMIRTVLMRRSSPPVKPSSTTRLPLRLAHSLVQTAWPSEVAKVLERTLREEKAADKKLTTIAESKANVKGGLGLVSGASHYNWLLRYSEGKLPRAAIAK
jgi:hypothetical protein